MEMSPPIPRLTVDQIYEQEIDRAARMAVDFRARRIYRGLVPLGLIAALDPRPLRVALIAVTAALIIWVSKREPQRLAREGFRVRFISENARVLSLFHCGIFLVTGGLGSPLLPILFVFTFLIALVIGRDPSLRPYLATQVATVVVLTVAQLLGWVDALTPAWLAPGFTPVHTVAAGATLTLLVGFAARFGAYLRSLLDQVLGRVVDTRADLLEAHRTQAEELTALSGAIAHELKNPLASVKGLASLLARDVVDGKPAERLVVLRREVDRMQAVLEEFLTFSRPLVPTVAAPTDLRALAHEVAALHEGLARDRGQRVVVTGPGGRAAADARKTRQVLINLVQNALEASPAGTSVVLDVATIGADVEVRVDDTGPGPDRELGARLFDPGVTTKPTGNGLGLTIARSLARQQGGELTLEGLPGGGARATLRLPMGAAP